MSARFSATRRMSCDIAAATAANTAPPPAVPEEWAGLTAVATRYGCRIQGATEVAFTVLDVLGYLDEIPVCVGYEIDGEVTKDFPTTRKAGKGKAGIYQRFPAGSAISAASKITKTCRRTAGSILNLWRSEIGYPITMVSNGPERDDIIYRKVK